jgi:hypothetical protein
MKTRLLAIGAAAALIASGLAACTTTPEAPAGGKKEITFLVFETPT